MDNGNASQKERSLIEDFKDMSPGSRRLFYLLVVVVAAFFSAGLLGECVAHGEPLAAKAKKAEEPKPEDFRKGPLRRNKKELAKRMWAAASLPDKPAFVPEPSKADVGIAIEDRTLVIHDGVIAINGKPTKRGLALAAVAGE